MHGLQVHLTCFSLFISGMGLESKGRIIRMLAIFIFRPGSVGDILVQV